MAICREVKKQNSSEPIIVRIAFMENIELHRLIKKKIYTCKIIHVDEIFI